MAIKLFGNSRQPRFQNEKTRKVRKKEKRSALDRIISVILVLVLLESLYCVAVFSNISFVSKYRTIWIETAMSTMSHQWLATYFIPPAVVSAVTDRVAEAQEAQIGVNSTWNVGEKKPATQSTAPVRTLPTTLPADQLAFYEQFSELDFESMEAYLAQHPSVTSSGWDNILINEAGLDDEGTDIRTTLGDQVLAVDAKNGILLIRITGNGYRGVLAIANDASRLSVQVAPSLGSSGSYAGDIAAAHDGVLAMNASGFIDDSGQGNGGTLAGYAMCDGIEYGNSHMGWGNKRVEFHEDNLMYITDSQDSVSEGTTDAVEFTPALIVDGSVLVDENCGWNAVNPRAIIGQNTDCDIMMFVVEGRFTDSVGTGVVECAERLAAYDCMQAMNLDGGTSAIMWYDGECVTRCCNTALPYGRPLPNAFVYKAAS